MNLTANFSLHEMTKSETALRKNMPNEPTEADIANLKLLAEKVLQPLRDHYGVGIKVNSGYRSPDVNAAVGGSRTSDHCKGLWAETLDARRNKASPRRARPKEHGAGRRAHSGAYAGDGDAGCRAEPVVGVVWMNAWRTAIGSQRVSPQDTKDQSCKMTWRMISTRRSGVKFRITRSRAVAPILFDSPLSSNRRASAASTA